MFSHPDEEQRFDNGLGATDQAAGLRRWAERQGLLKNAETIGGAEHLQPASVEPSVPPKAPMPEEAAFSEPEWPSAPVVRHTLMVLGLPDTSAHQCQRAWDALARWHNNGHRWIGHPDEWRVVALESSSPHLSVLADQQSRWALWVDGDLDSFRRAYVTLRELAELGRSWRLLVLHPGIPSHRGFLTNLQQAAASFLGIELLLLPEYLGGDNSA